MVGRSGRSQAGAADRDLEPGHVLQRRARILDCLDAALVLVVVHYPARPVRDDERLIARAQESKGYKAALEMVYEAIQMRATDIHLEPTKNEMTVRLRID